MSKPLNKYGHPIYSECRSCGEDFAGDDLFSRHRVGTHEFTYEEGLKMVPPVEHGRRCLTEAEMRKRGWRVDKKGRWFDPVKRQRAVRAFSSTSGQR